MLSLSCFIRISFSFNLFISSVKLIISCFNSSLLFSQASFSSCNFFNFSSHAVFSFSFNCFNSSHAFFSSSFNSIFFLSVSSKLGLLFISFISFVKSTIVVVNSVILFVNSIILSLNVFISSCNSFNELVFLSLFRFNSSCNFSFSAFTISSCSFKPFSVEPFSVEPSSVEPSSVEPSSVEPFSVEPSSVEPSSFEPSSFDGPGVNFTSIFNVSLNVFPDVLPKLVPVFIGTRNVIFPFNILLLPGIGILTV